MIKPLEVFCVDFLLEHLDRDKDVFFTIFQFCVDCSVDKRLMEKCITILRTDWNYLMELTWREDGEVEESFLKISQKCLVRFLDVDFPYAQEIDLFNLVSICFCFIIAIVSFFRLLHGQRLRATEIQQMVKRFAQN